MLFCGHDEMSVDEDREHAKGAIVLDEAHAAHIGSKIVNGVGIFQSGVASFPGLKVQLDVLRLGRELVPCFQRLLIYCTNVRKTLSDQVSNEMAADESTGATDNNFISQFH